jgi:hypothetical protein
MAINILPPEFAAIGPFPAPLSDIPKLRPVLYSQLRIEPVSTYHITVWGRFTLRLSVHRQSFRLGDKLLETHDQ